ncbi:hypothetical protein YC2023_002886 [Brassica napus]
MGKGFRNIIPMYNFVHDIHYAQDPSIYIIICEIDITLNELERLILILLVSNGKSSSGGADQTDCADQMEHVQIMRIKRDKYISSRSNDLLIDLKSVAGPPAHEINHTSYTGANSNIGVFKEGYLCNHEEFNRETSCYRFSTQPEHAANWFHTKRSNGL